jgi:hypothetical protein
LSAVNAMDIARHHGTRGKMPAMTSKMKITAAATAQESSENRRREKRGRAARAGTVSAGEIEEGVMIRAP